MTTLLEQAFAEASKLSEREQDAIAAALLSQLGERERLGYEPARMSEALATLVARARADIAAGRSRPFSSNDV